ncbi:hypothetical protein EMCRGX_G031636 [Ephydatia muelleri]
MGKKHKKHKHASRQEHEAPEFGDRTLSEMRVVFQLPRTVQVGHTQEPRSTHAVTQLLVSIPLDALRPQSPAEEPENFSPAAERKHHKHKKHKKNKRHLSDSHREADNRSSDDLPVDVEESSPRPMAPLKFSYKIQPTPPRLPPPPSLVHTPEASGHSRSGKQRHFPPGDSSEAESPVVARGSAERALARSTGKPTTLAGLASLSESDSQRHKKRKHKHHHHPQEDAASFSPMGGDKTVMVSQVVGKEPSTLSKKARLDVPPSQPPMPSFAGEPSVGISRSAIEPKTVSKAPVELSLATPRLPLDPSRTRSSSVTSNSHSFPSRPTTPHGRPLTPTASAATPPQGKLSTDVLKAFLKDLHQQIAKRDPEGIFAEPVTDDIAPGYSAIISHPLDLKTILKKIETNQYSSVNEFRDDFELMCNNAMTYNTPDTVYYGSAKRLLTFGVKLIAKEASLRPDISYSVVQPPGGVQDFRLPVPSSSHVDYSSPWLCRISLQAMSGPSQPSPSAIPPPLSISDQNEVVDIGDEGGPKSVPPPLTTVQDDEVVVVPVETYEAVGEEEMETTELPDFCFLNSEKGKTFLNILNPDIGTITSAKPLDLSFLSDRVKMGDNAASLLQSDLAMYKATPVSYLMFGPFGSFAPVFDSTFATLTKQDSELLLTAYGNDTGVSYAHSLQQFVKDTGGFVSEMAQALLNGLTGGRHRKLLETIELKEGKEQVSSKRGSVVSEQVEGDGVRSIGELLEVDSTEGEAIELVSASTGTVAERLQQTSQMIANLYQQQLGRLSQLSAVVDEGLFAPQPPSEKELGTAQAVAMGLASLTSQLQPQDVISLQAVRQAMGISTFVPQPQDVPVLKNTSIDE